MITAGMKRELTEYVEKRIEKLFAELAPIGEASSMDLVIAALRKRGDLPEYRNSPNFSVIVHPG